MTVPATAPQKTNTQQHNAMRITDKVKHQVDKMVMSGRLELPPNYSAANALASAWLTLQGVEDRNHAPALQVCTELSITRSLLEMTYSGLTPAKKQVWFIVRGKELTLQVSVFGNMMFAKRVNPHIVRFEAYLVYKGENVVTGIRNGCEIVLEHQRNPFARYDYEGEGLHPDCIGAYCNIIYDDGHWESDIMTISEIRRAWHVGSAKMDSKAHRLRPEEMVKRTVINHACKMIIRSSDDSSLFGQTVREIEQSAARADAEQLARERTNIIDVDFEDVQTHTTLPAPELNRQNESPSFDDDLSNLEPETDTPMIAEPQAVLGGAAQTPEPTTDNPGF